MPICAVLAFTACSSGEDPPAPPQATTRAVTTSAPSFAGPPDGVLAVDVGETPIGLTIDPDQRVWVVLTGDRSLVGLAPAGEGYEVGTPIPLDGLPLRVLSASDGLWVSLFDVGMLQPVDPATGTAGAPIPGGDEPEGMALTGTEGAETLWVVDQAGGVVQRLQQQPAGPRTVDGTAEVGIQPRLVAPAGPGVVVAAYTDGTVSYVGADLSVRTSAEICAGPQGLAVADDRVWVACTASGEVVVLDLATMEEVGRIAELPLADSVAIAPDGSVYVALQSGPTIVAIDPAAMAERARVQLGDGVAGTNGNVVVISDFDGRALMTWPEAGQLMVVPADLLTA